MTHRSWLVGLISILMVAVEPCLAYADFGFAPGSASFEILSATGDPENRAGVHPDHVNIEFAFNTVGEAADGNVKDITVELPPGFVGNPNAVPGCPRQIFDGGLEGKECPAESQVGVATLTLPGLGEQTLRVFNVQAAPDQLAELGEALIVKFPMEMKLAPDDFRAILEQRDITQAIPLTAIKTELWGIPADHQEGTSLSRHAFLTTPTRCDGKPPGITIRARSWQEPEVWREVSVNTGAPLTGCSVLRFEPSIDLTFSNPTIDEPTGVQIDIANLLSNDPDGLESSSIESVAIALPDEMSVSPSGLESVVVCTYARFGLGSSQPPDCPAASRVGTVEITGPLLRTSLTGDIFLGEEQPGGRFRLFVVAQGLGIDLKLDGELRLDAETGKLWMVLGDLPQVPFGRIELRLLGGSRALLTTPLACGLATANITFAPYSGGPVVQLPDATNITRSGGGSACPKEAPFLPEFSMRSSHWAAGGSPTLGIGLVRHSGEQPLSDFTVKLPKGFTAELGSVEPCGSSDAALGRCPSASRIGSVTASVGSGPEPATLDGESFFTGPYRGAPFGIAIILPVVLGPFDFGTFVIRGTIRSLPLSGQLVIATDTLPRTIRGVSVRLQSMSLDIDRRGFVHNPTSCAPSSAEAVIRSVTGLRSRSTSPLVVNRCNSLRFRPTVSMGLTGADEMDLGGKPGLSLAIRTPPRSTNLRSIRLPLPGDLRVDASGLQALCARGEAIAGRCPVGSNVGTAVARSPLLREPLDGKVYAVQPHRNGLPDLWTSLRSSGLRLEVRGQTFFKGTHLNAKLVGIPDIPLSSLKMRLYEGRRSPFALGQRLCAGVSVRTIARTVAFEGQNRAYRLAKVRVRHPSCKNVEQQGTGRD